MNEREQVVSRALSVAFANIAELDGSKRAGLAKVFEKAEEEVLNVFNPVEKKPKAAKTPKKK